MFIDKSKKVWACGLNDFNQIGIEKMAYDGYSKKKIKLTEVPLPIKVQTLSNIKLLQMNCGANHSLSSAMVHDRNALISWGMHKQS